MCPGEADAISAIKKFVGKAELLFSDFKHLFLRGIYRTALLDMIDKITEFSKGNEHIPLTIKLDTYRRSLMLDAITSADGETNQKGE